MPRKITNKYSLPETLVKAITMDTHKSHGTISCTELIDSPKIRLMKKANVYESDVTDNLYALMGTALHHILERANIESVRKRSFIMTAETIIKHAEELKGTNEERSQQLSKVGNYLFSLIPYFFPEMGERYIFEQTFSIQLKGEHVLSMTFDLYDTQEQTLWDYKFCSTFQYLFPESREKWYQQTNVYAYGLDLNGYPVKAIKILAFFRNWSSFELMRNRDYPKQQILEISVPLGNPNDPLKRTWQEQVAGFIDKRIDMHIAAENGEVQDCTGKDRWASSDSWAVMKRGLKRAVKLFVSEPLAQEFVRDNTHIHKGLYIEYRPGKSRRCENFCPVSKFCQQYADEKKRLQELSEEEAQI